MMELILILVIVMVVFGAGKLPSVGDALGKAIKNFRRSSLGLDSPSEESKAQLDPSDRSS
jgi:sec-independent protein translocase protein TatA